MGYLLNGQTLPLDVAWRHPETGVQYPANWLRLSTDRDRELLGITWAEDVSNSYDQRFYTGPNNPKRLEDEAVLDEDGNATGMVMAGLKSTWKAKQDQIAAGALALSDWRVIKAKETGTNIPSVWKTYRAAVRTACNTRQTEIDACSDVAALKELLFGPQKIAQTDDDGEFVTKTVTLQRQQTDKDGVGVTDDDGNAVMEDYTEEQPVMIANPNIATAWPDPVE
tara:strand:+ start:3017 stop:3688 length:672 start_codon:yes stop_codon:yes gene_type:complete